MKLVLASESKYRKELLSRLHIEFEAVGASIDERQYHHDDPVQLSLILAKAKATNVLERNPEAFVIGSDQVAVLDHQVLHKPGTVENAKKQLTMMSGKTHYLHTSVALLSKNTEKIWTVSVELAMRHLSELEIERYIAIDQPLDCAGSYKIESLGISLFDRILTEDQTTIIGLPLLSLAKELRNLGYRCP